MHPSEAERLAYTAANMADLLEEAILPRPAPETKEKAREWLDAYYDVRDAYRSRQAPAPEKEKP